MQKKSNKHLGHENNLFTHFYEHLKDRMCEGVEKKI